MGRASGRGKFVRMTKAWLEARGAIHAPMELWIPGTAITRDGFGFVDLVAIIGATTFGVQVCRAADIAAHVNKIFASPFFDRVAAAWQVVVIGWKEEVPSFGPPSWTPRVVHCVREVADNG